MRLTRYTTKVIYYFNTFETIDFFFIDNVNRRLVSFLFFSKGGHEIFEKYHFKKEKRKKKRNLLEISRDALKKSTNNSKTLENAEFSGGLWDCTAGICNQKGHQRQ